MTFIVLVIDLVLRIFPFFSHIFRMFTMLNAVYDHFLTRKPPFFTLFILSRTSDQCSNCRGLGVEPPTSPCRPPTSGQNSTPGGRVSTPHLSFVEVGMLLDSHFLLMQFLKYLGLHHDDLNVTTS